MTLRYLRGFFIFTILGDFFPPALRRDSGQNSELIQYRDIDTLILSLPLSLPGARNFRIALDPTVRPTRATESHDQNPNNHAGVKGGETSWQFW